MEQTTQPISENKKDSGNKVVIIILIVMIVLLGGAGAFLGYQYMNMGKIVKKKSEEITSLNKSIEEKDQKLTELEKRIQELEGNGSLTKEEADELRNQIAQLQQELEEARNNPKIVYRDGGGGGTNKKIQELEEIIAAKEEQFNMLRAERDKLSEENKKLTNDMMTTNQEKQDLQVRNKDMENKLNLAAALKITGSTLTGYRLKKNGDKVYEEKSKKIAGLEIQFTIMENVVAQSGDKVAYIVIIGPNKKVLSESTSNTFQYMGVDKVYSVKKDFYYSNKDTEMTADFKTKEQLTAGEYRAEVFIDGALAGYSTATFK